MTSELPHLCVEPFAARHAGPSLSAAFAELAELEYRLGDWSAAHASALESLRAARSADLGREAMTSLVQLASIEAGLGRSRACRRHAAKAIELGRRYECKAVEAIAGEAIGFLELGLGRVARAIERLERVGEVIAGHPAACAGATAWAGDLAEAYLRRGDRAGAERAVARLEEQVSQMGSYVLAATLERSRAMLADDDAFEPLFQRALGWNARAQQPLEYARTQLSFGERLQLAGRSPEAFERVSKSLETFEALSARLWAERARQVLAASSAWAGRRSSPGKHPAYAAVGVVAALAGRSSAWQSRNLAR
jgi:tetratricopeptide (TPR) repeat protein